MYICLYHGNLYAGIAVIEVINRVLLFSSVITQQMLLEMDGRCHAVCTLTVLSVQVLYVK